MQTTTTVRTEADYRTIAIQAFKLGWSKSQNAYAEFVGTFAEDEQSIIPRLISKNERKWIAQFRSELEDYRSVVPTQDDLVTDIDGVEVVYRLQLPQG